MGTRPWKDSGSPNKKGYLSDKILEWQRRVDQEYLDRGHSINNIHNNKYDSIFMVEKYEELLPVPSWKYDFQNILP